jgi:hypothetical protein
MGPSLTVSEALRNPVALWEAEDYHRHPDCHTPRIDPRAFGASDKRTGPLRSRRSPLPFPGAANLLKFVERDAHQEGQRLQTPDTSIKC